MVGILAAAAFAIRSTENGLIGHISESRRKLIKKISAKIVKEFTTPTKLEINSLSIIVLHTNMKHHIRVLL